MSACPWGDVVTTPPRNSPKLQEILDEELAKKLNTIELNAAADSPSAPVTTDGIFDHLNVSYASFAASRNGDAGDLPAPDNEVEYDDHEYDDEEDEYMAKSHKLQSGGRRKTDISQKLRLGGGFDDRTRFVLGKLAIRGLLSAVNARLHSSLIAQIHHGIGSVAGDDDEGAEPAQVHYAVKILKASSVDRSKTVESLEQSGRPTNDAMIWMSVRRQLKIQLDHEYNALSRAVACGVRAPAPHCSWEHVMATQFIGDESQPAPSLRDVRLNPGQLSQAYVDLLVAMRAMYREAKLVHGELNEFNILYHKDACWIVDFSHAIDTTHAEHVEALDRDIESITSFFGRSGMPKVTKHRVGLLDEASVRELITDVAPGKVLSAYPWLKPYFYKKK